MHWLSQALQLWDADIFATPILQGRGLRLREGKPPPRVLPEIAQCQEDSAGIQAQAVRFRMPFLYDLFLYPWNCEYAQFCGPGNRYEENSSNIKHLVYNFDLLHPSSLYAPAAE